jgi:hypothetical protein
MLINILSSSPTSFFSSSALVTAYCHFGRNLPILLLSCSIVSCLVLLFAPTALAQPPYPHAAFFWLSDSKSDPEIPSAVPDFRVAPGTTGVVHIWGQPVADKTLQGFSLDLLAEPEGVVRFMWVDVLNPPAVPRPGDSETGDSESSCEASATTLCRHQIVHDSDSDDGELPVGPDAIIGMKGFTIFVGHDELRNGAGIGPSCGDDDGVEVIGESCFDRPTGDAWLIATVAYTAASVSTPTSAELNLQVGQLGLLHAGASASETEAVFRNARITVATVVHALPGDMNGDGLVNFGDLSPFVKALTDTAGYAAMFPDLDRVARCDTSGDGSCNFGDLSPFTALLTNRPGGATALVPEPAVWTLWCAMALILVTRRCAIRSFP